MKLHAVHPLHYTFQDYFDYEVKKRNILVMPYYIRVDVAGFNINDDVLTIAYQEKDPVARQNFTKCHELAHILLNHNGRVFTDFHDNSLQEREANFFFSFILMPNIVLLTKLFYQKKTFQEVEKELQVSSQALKTRLVDFLDFELNLNRLSAYRIVEDYITRSNQHILNYFEQVKDFIISDFNDFEPTLIDKLSKLLQEKDFVSDIDFPSLADETFIKQVQQVFPNVKRWAIYDRGKTIFYIWNSEQLTELEAKRRANVLLITKK